jgi:hypothetical protein
MDRGSHANTFTFSLPTVIMKLSTWALYLTSLDVASAWQLIVTQRNGNTQSWAGTNPQGCRTVDIPRGAEIYWQGSHGANTVQFFNVKGSCSRVYRTMMGQGEINASNNIYGFVVKT